MTTKSTKKRHDMMMDLKNRHTLLHQHLDELIACFVTETKALPSKTTLMEFLNWSYSMTHAPTCASHYTLDPSKDVPATGCVPTAFVERNYELAKGSYLFGVPVEDLTQREAIAGMMQAYRDLAALRAQHEKDRVTARGHKLQ